uniref:Probable isoaspartyl peptidase/L-asparaginase GA20639 n=3 Tax=Cacopsylla melanoneura TaxID=428564 RepID=A0A8D8Y8X9_9HEMI
MYVTRCSAVRKRHPYQSNMAQVEPVILIHGGAGDIPESKVQGKLDGVKKAVRLGHKKFIETGCVLEGTQAAIEYMEEDDNFNAGRGSVLTTEGEIEMEALIVDGKDIKVGSVTGVKNILHPIVLARLVMEKTPHGILSGDGANEFGLKMGLPQVSECDLITETARNALQKFLHEGKDPNVTEIGGVGTVGAVAVDAKGHMVSCTSTGGITGKMKGRVGDTPIPGSGGYADDNIGSVSTTGHGDSILRYCVAHRILNYIEQGLSATEASQKALDGMTERVGKTAGAITVTKAGDVGIYFNSKKMAWAYIRGNKLHYGINPGQELIEDV